MLDISTISHPFHGNFTELLGSVSKAAFQNICKKFCDDYAFQARGLGKPVEDLLLKSKNLKNDVWFFNSELGSANMFVTGLPPRPVRAEGVYAQIALAAIKAGLIHEFEYTIPQYTMVSFLNRVITGNDIKIRYRNNNLSIANTEGLTWGFSSNPLPDDIDGIWFEANNPNGVVRAGSCMAFVVTGNEWDPIFGDSDHIPVPLDPEMKDAVERAMDRLECLSPEYYLWVVSALNQIIPVKRYKQEALGSSSSLCNFGNVQIAESFSTTEIIEMLVHESSHQYFLLAKQFTTMIQNRAPMAYSALKQTERPLEKVMTAFHAMGNCLLVFSDLHNEAERQREISRFDHIRELTRSLRESLAKNVQHLTGDGRRFFDSLEAALIEKRLLEV